MDKFLAADHHMWHKNIINFPRTDGRGLLRPFKTIEHMHEHVITQHNSVVSQNDTTFFLGDVTLSRSSEKLEILNRFNGRKVLVKGNHDIARPSDYLKYFEDICSVVELDKVVLSHLPLHRQGITRWAKNIHGHLHDDVVLLEGTKLPDTKYKCVSLEQLDNYQPLNFNSVNK